MDQKKRPLSENGTTNFLQLPTVLGSHFATSQNVHASADHIFKQTRRVFQARKITAIRNSWTRTFHVWFVESDIFMVIILRRFANVAFIRFSRTLCNIIPRLQILDPKNIFLLRQQCCAVCFISVEHCTVLSKKRSKMKRTALRLD